MCMDTTQTKWEFWNSKDSEENDRSEKVSTKIH